jgi:hypothetical protein
MLRFPTGSDASFGDKKMIADRFLPEKESGAYGIRTRDLLNAIEALYQLS